MPALHLAPPFEFELECHSSQLDLDRCFFSGQVFRWRKVNELRYEGVDGGNWYRVERHGDTFNVASNARREQFEDFLNLSRDLTDIERRIVTAAPEMAPYMGCLQGLRILRPSDPTEVFFSFMCTANNNVKRITPMVAKLGSFGQTIDGVELRRFPRVADVARIPEQSLRELGFGYRGATIPHAAGEIESRGGDDWLVGLKRVGYEAAHRELVSIKGIGNKLADCICLYGLHYEEAVPIDTHLWQAACRVFFPEHSGKALTELRYREVGDFFRERFGELAGWAHLYLYYENMLNWRSRSGSTETIQ